MAEIVLFHDVQGRTPGMTAFADQLRTALHTVHVPDLFDGATSGTLDEGMAHVEQVAMERLLDVGVAASRDLPAELVHAGFFVGVLPARELAQTRRGARGAPLFQFLGRLGS